MIKDKACDCDRKEVCSKCVDEKFMAFCARRAKEEDAEMRADLYRRYEYTEQEGD